jgi:hypothetical protein
VRNDPGDYGTQNVEIFRESLKEYKGVQANKAAWRFLNNLKKVLKIIGLPWDIFLSIVVIKSLNRSFLLELILKNFARSGNPLTWADCGDKTVN